MPNRSSPHEQVASIPSREVDAILERGIRLVRERSDVVLNAVDDGIYVLDQSGHTIFANEAAVRLLGYTLREMLGRPQHALIHHTHADGSAFPVEECPIYNAAQYGVYQRVGGDTFWRKDGRPVSVDYTSTPIKEGRAVVGAVVTFRSASNEQRENEIAEARPSLAPIGHVASPLTDRADAPKQGDEGGPDAWVVLDPLYGEAARDLVPGDDILLLTWLDRGDRAVLSVHPRDDESAPQRGVFSTRSSDRPNPIGVHRVTILAVDEPTRLRVGPLEAIDGTPVLDIKPVLDAARER
jgi:tRNA-Thr(GGU) m(6)t(6)A37 methyltransferase TsaA